MIEIIVATDVNGGIGYENSLPWKSKEEMNIFYRKTLYNSIIVGRKTFETMPELKDRKVFVLGTNFYTDIRKVLEEAFNLGNKIFICGGGQIYKYFLENYSHLISKIHISIFKDSYKCDTYLTLDLGDYSLVDAEKHGKFTHYVYVPKFSGEMQYLNLLKTVMSEGKEIEGRNGQVINLFSRELKFDLRKGFPLLTTKKMFFKGIVEELLFFISGKTDSKLLESKKVNIWKGNTCKEFLEKQKLDYKEGLMGPMYGYQWRHFNARYISETGENAEEGIDQLQNVINLIKTDPTSRRIVMTDYNPAQAHQGVLYPCHSLILQFFAQENYLDMYCYNRSSDLLLGLPFNIASSSLLLSIIAKITGKIARHFTLALGDCHIYRQHIESVKTQIERIPYKFPNLIIGDILDVDSLSSDMFKISGYESYPAIKAEMIA